MNIGHLLILVVIGVIGWLIVMKYGKNLLNLMPTVKTSETPKLETPLDSTFDELKGSLDVA